MSTDVIVYNGFNFTRYPDSKHTSDRMYYNGWVRIDGKRRKIRLHVYKYLCEKGAIPEGYHVHHKDENSLNNEIDNLELLPKFVHLSYHYSLLSDEHKKQKTVILITQAQEKAKEWHKSNEGSEWHKQHAKKTLWCEPVERICLKCGKPFIQTFVTNTKYCSKKCKNAYNSHLMRQKKKLIG